MKKKLGDILYKKSTKQDDVDAILSQCLHAKSHAEASRALKVQQEIDADLYYTGKLPGPTIDNGEYYKDSAKPINEYVEPYLYNAVKRALPQVLDSFTSDEKMAAVFRSRGFMRNPQLEEIVTLNVNKIFLQEQDGYHILTQTINRILRSGSGVNKVYVDEYEQHESLTLDEWVELSGLVSQLAEGWSIDPPSEFNDQTQTKGSVKGFEWKTEKGIALDPNTGQPVESQDLYIKGKIKLIKKDKKLVVEQVDIKDLYFDTSYGDDFDKCRHITHKIVTTKGEALARGFDPEKIETATLYREDDVKLPEMYFTPDMYEHPIKGGDLRSPVSTDPKEEKITLYETYIYSSLLTKNGETRQYQVTHTGTEVLSIQEIKRFPFVHGKAENIHGQFFGKGLYEICKPYQDALTYHQRIQMHIGKLSAYPQYIAVSGQFDLKSLQNNYKPGNVVEIKSAGAVDRLVPQQLTSTFSEAFTRLKESSVETLQASGGAANIEAGVPQVAAATVAMSIYQDAQKGAILVKNIARTYIKPLMNLIYEVIRDEGWTLETQDGQTISGVELPQSYEWIVDTFTPGDDLAQQMQTTAVAQFVQAMANPQLQSPVITPQNVYAMAKDMCDKFDLDTSRYLTDPSQNQDPHAAEEEAEYKAIQSEAAKVDLQHKVVLMRKDAADVALIEAKTEELIRGGNGDRMKQQQDSANKAAEIVAKAKVATEANQVKAKEVEVKNKAVNYEAILKASKHSLDHSSDITGPNINGIR